MCGGFFELFLAKDFGASCAEVENNNRPYHCGRLASGFDYFDRLYGDGRIISFFVLSVGDMCCFGKKE